MSQLFIEQLLSYNEARILITTPLGTVQGFMTQEIGISGSASYNSPEMTSKVGALNNAANKVAALANKFGMNVSQFQLKNVASTMLNYQGSQHFRLDIPLILVAIRPGDDIRKRMAILLKCTYPTISGSVNWGSMIKAPAGYQIGDAANPKGTTAIQVSTWLKVPAIMVVINVSFSVSKEVTKDGFPLYATGIVSLQSARIVSADEIERYLS